MAFIQVYQGEPVPDIHPLMNMIPTALQHRAEPTYFIHLSTMSLVLLRHQVGSFWPHTLADTNRQF